MSEANTKIEVGGRVQWTYRHHLNTKSSVLLTKVGVFEGLCRHTVKHWRKHDSKQMVWVHFDGNKRASKVPMCEIYPLKEVEKV